MIGIILIAKMISFVFISFWEWDTEMDLERKYFHRFETISTFISLEIKSEYLDTFIWGILRVLTEDFLISEVQSRISHVLFDSNLGKSKSEGKFCQVEIEAS